MSLTVLVDSDAFVAMSKHDDSSFLKSQRIINDLKLKHAKLFTSNYVFSETITVISQKIGHDAALSYINIMKSPHNPFGIRWIDETIENMALQIFAKQTSKNTSFIDCTNMAIMKHDNLDAIFSFDEIYRKNGFKLVSSL